MKWKARILSEYDTPICALRLAGVFADEKILIVKTHFHAGSYRAGIAEINIQSAEEGVTQWLANVARWISSKTSSSDFVIPHDG
jgi:hypothetical protein